MLNETISVGTLKLKNRLVMPPMATGKSAGGIVTDDLLEYYRERAVKNGFGLIITEQLYYRGWAGIERSTVYLSR